MIQHVLAFRHPQKTRTLLKGLGAKLWHLQKLPAGTEAAFFLPVSGDVFCHRSAYPCHPAQQGGRSCVQVHPHRVYTVLHHPIQSLGKLGLGHIMLVLAHADGLGINFHKFRQGILQAAGNGHRRTKGHVKVRELFRPQLGGRIYRGPGLANHHIRNLPPILLDKLTDKDFRLPAGSAVANSDAGNAVAVTQPAQHPLAFLCFVMGLGGINHRCLQHLAGAVHYSQLAACAIGGVKAQGNLVFHRGLHQQGPQVQGKGADGLLVRHICEIRPHLPL